MKPKALIFDISGVVMNFATDEEHFEALHAWSEAIGADPEVVARIRKEHLREMFHGKYRFGDFVKDISAAAGKPSRDPEAAWVEVGMARVKMNEPLLDWIDGARARYAMAIGSNLTTLRQHLDVETGIYDHFDRLFLSTEMGLMKPDPAFLELCARELGLRLEEVVFIDDLERNVAVAASLGMPAIRFLPEYWADLGPFLLKLKELGVE